VEDRDDQDSRRLVAEQKKALSVITLQKLRQNAKAVSPSPPTFVSMFRFSTCSRSALRTTTSAFSLFLLLVIPSLFANAADTPIHAGDAVRPNNLGVAYMNQQRSEDALAQFKLAIAADNTLAVPHLNAGIVLLVMQKLPEARAQLDQAAKLDPQNPRVWYNLGLLERAQSNCEASIRDFEQVVKLDPSSADAHYFLGSCYLEQQKFDKAADEYREAIRLNPMHPSAEFGLARALQRSGTAAEARTHLARFEHITKEKLGPVIAPTYGDQGAYSIAQEIKSASPPVGPMIPITFANLALPSPRSSAPAATTSSELGGGICLIDLEGKGKPDLIALNSGDNAITYYHHTPDGNFELGSAQKLGLVATGHAVACTVGDFDNDTHPDLAIAMSNRVILYRNQGDGTFADVTEKSGITQLNNPAGLTFIDFDHDGDIDLFVTGSPREGSASATSNVLWRNNGNQSFTEWTTPTALGGSGHTTSAVLSDLNNDRAVDFVVAGDEGVTLYFNPREGKFIGQPLYPKGDLPPAVGLTILDFNKDGWMDIAVTHSGTPGLTLWKNIDGKRFERVSLPLSDAKRAWGVTPIDVDNDGWIDLAAVVETSKGIEARVLRNKGDGSFEDITAALGLDKPLSSSARSLVAFDADGDGDADLLVALLDGPPSLLRNDGGNKNHSVLIDLQGNADNKTAIGTKIEIFAGSLWQKWEVPGASGYLSQGAGSILAGLGASTEPVIVRLLWPTGVPQDELNVAAKGTDQIKELDRRGSSCPVVFAWNGSKYEFITDTIGAAVIGHWVSPYAHNIPDPDEWIKVEGSQLQPRDGYLSLRFGEPMEEVNFVDQARLVAIDHPANSEVYPNERFKNDPPFPEKKTIFTKEARPVAGAWDNNGNDVLATLASVDHQYVRDFTNLPYAGFANAHTLTLDLGAWSPDKPLRLLLHGFIEYFSATSLYSAWQAGLAPISPYIEAQLPDGSWTRVVDDMGFPAGLPRTIVADLSGKLPVGATRIRITTNLQIYWDQILVSNESDRTNLVKETEVPLATASLGFRGYPRQIDGATPGDLTYHYNEASVTGPFVRQRGPYTHYGDVTSLLKAIDDRFVIFGSGEDIDLEFNASALPPLPAGWKRDYFFYANGYVKDMDYYEAMPFTVAAMPFHEMSGYPYNETEHFPDSDESLDYQLSWNDRFESGISSSFYLFDYQPREARPITPLSSRSLSSDASSGFRVTNKAR
jgi:tetratricopeptide (TPR) repeat protein